MSYEFWETPKETNPTDEDEVQSTNGQADGAEYRLSVDAFLALSEQIDINPDKRVMLSRFLEDHAPEDFTIRH